MRLSIVLLATLSFVMLLAFVGIGHSDAAVGTPAGAGPQWAASYYDHRCPEAAQSRATPGMSRLMSSADKTCDYKVVDKGKTWIKIKCTGTTTEWCLRAESDGWYSCSITGAFRGKTFEKAVKEVCHCD
jgi:hypothetical protein